MPLRLSATVITFARELFSKKDLIWSLALRDFRKSYFGSTLGMTWALAEPIIYIFVMWFFFTKALRVQPNSGYPFVAWLMAAMIIWSFFASAFQISVGTFRNYAYMLRRPDFNMSILPVVTILSSMFMHAIFIALLVVLLLISHIPSSWFWMQALYYLFATSVLLIGLSWITASISLFIKDIANVVGVILQIGFWVSPVFWDLNTYPQEYRFLPKMNPLTYLLEGYRKSFLYREPFWQDTIGALYFWTFTIVILGIGMITYKKLRPHFGDMI